MSNKAKNTGKPQAKASPNVPKASQAPAASAAKAVKKDTPIPPRNNNRAPGASREPASSLPGFVERLDDSAEREELNAIQAQIEKLKKTIDTQSNQIKDILAKKKKFGDEIVSSIDYIQQQLRPNITQIHNQRKALIDQTKVLKSNKDNLQSVVFNAETKELPARRKFEGNLLPLDEYVTKNYEEIESTLKSLDHQLLNSGGDERRIISDINKWKAKRNQLETYRANVMELDNLKTQLAQIDQRFKNLNETHTKLTEEKKVLDDKIEAAKAGQAKCEEEFKRLRADNDASREQRDKLYQELKGKRDLLNAKWDSWKAERKVEKDKRDEKKKQQAAERQRRDQERLAKKRAEDVRRLPLKDEIEAATELEKYLDEIQDNKANQKQISHDLDILVQFERISLIAPAAFDQVAASKAEVHQRKLEYTQLQQEISAARKAKHSDKKSEQAETKAEPASENLSAPGEEEAPADDQAPVDDQAPAEPPADEE